MNMVECRLVSGTCGYRMIHRCRKTLAINYSELWIYYSCSEVSFCDKCSHIWIISEDILAYMDFNGVREETCMPRLTVRAKVMAHGEKVPWILYIEHFTERRLNFNFKSSQGFLNNCLVEPRLEPVIQVKKRKLPTRSFIIPTDQKASP